MARLRFDYVPGSFRKLFVADQRRMAEAATASVRQVTGEAKDQGRASIASAGFSSRWQNALRARVYPSGGSASLNAAGVVSLNIPYASLFEEGGTVTGRPFLWLPIEANLPVRGGRRWTPAAFARSVGPLRSARNRRGRPLLLAKIGKAWVPVFVGVDQAVIAKKFAVTEAARAANARLPGVYDAKLKSS